MSPELIATLLGLGGAAVGYAFREWRNRVTPFFEVIDIDGRATKRSETVPVPKPIIQELNDSFYLGELQPESNLGDIYDCWDRCDDLKQLWPKTKTAIEKVIAAATDHEFIVGIAEVLQFNKADWWLQQLLLSSKLDFQLDTNIANAPEKIHFWFDEEDEKCVWFDLPPSGRSFGKRMDHAAVRGKCMPFITALSKLHRSGIQHAFREYVRILESDYRKALACIHDLKKIDQENSQWAFYAYLANTSNTPIVIEKSGTVTIVDAKTRPKQRHPCYLCLVNEKSLSLSDTRTPLVVAAGEGKTIALLTCDRQKNMKLGSVLREVYERGDGKCHVSVVLRRPGFLRRQRYHSASVPFMASQTKKVIRGPS